MRRIKQHADSIIMLQKSLLFLHTVDEDKNYSEELELNSIRTFPLSDFSTVITICMVISILGLIGNGITICLLCCASRKTKYTVYVSNLAVGDFCALVRTSVSYLEFFTPCFINIHARQLMFVMFLFGHGKNSYFLAAMSTERCLTVFFPVWYHSHQGKCSTTFVCAFLWTVSVTLSVLEHFLCTMRYISALNMGTFPCKVETIFKYIMNFIILTPNMVFSTLALCIRMKIKPQQDFPTRLDISIWIIVALNLIFFPAADIIGFILFYIRFRYYLQYYYLTIIFDCMGSCVNPFVYLLVGCWKRKKDQEPFYMFLDRALKDERKGSIRTQPGQEQA